jgi:predicted KAP-like P-loop ATPase
VTKRKHKRETTDQPGNEVYGSDAPASDPKQDRFGRFPFAQRVAQTLARRGDPSSIVIAIHGAWGEGKTTVLAYIDSELRGFYPDLVCVRFNPWRFTDEGTLLKSFFDTVADGLKRSLTACA